MADAEVVDWLLDAKYAGSMPLLDRAADLRSEPDVVAHLRDDPATRTIVVRDGRLRVRNGKLIRVAPSEVGEATWALLGRDSDGMPLLVARVAPIDDSLDAVPDEHWLDLRSAGGHLDEHESDVFVTSVALAAWLGDFNFCSSCGGAAALTDAGWSRMCGSCGKTFFPRTDPAVIVAIENPTGDKLLLGANAAWRGRFYSCFAGFVELGESLESTMHREIAEEAGVQLSNLEYIGSQAWPFPRSIMLGFRAVAVSEEATPDGEEIIDLRWLTRDEVGSALAGNGPVGLPGPASIARRLIVDWYERPLSPPKCG